MDYGIVSRDIEDFGAAFVKASIFISDLLLHLHNVSSLLLIPLLINEMNHPF